METPVAVVRACAAMMPRLKAEEALHAVDCIGVGFGTMAKHDAKTTHLEWVEQARGPQSRVVVRQPRPEDLARIGIGVRKVSRGH